jgi:hypothetical protein
MAARSVRQADRSRQERPREIESVERTEIMGRQSGNRIVGTSGEGQLLWAHLIDCQESSGTQAQWRHHAVVHFARRAMHQILSIGMD